MKLLVNKKRDMETDSNSLESDPYKSQGLKLDSMQRNITNALKDCVYEYCEIFTGR